MTAIFMTVLTIAICACFYLIKKLNKIVKKHIEITLKNFDAVKIVLEEITDNIRLLEEKTK